MNPLFCSLLKYLFFVSIDICVDIDVPEFFLLLCLAIHQDALACWCCRPFWKTLRKKKKCESSREHTKNTWFAFTSQNLYIPPFLFFYSFPRIFFSFLITFYNFPSSFSCCWEKKIVSFFLSHLHVVHERVYLLLKGGFRSFLKYAHAISHVVCVIIRNTHSHTHTHTTWTGKWRETHLNYTYIIYLCTFFSHFCLIGLLLYQWWITKDDPHLLKHAFWGFVYLSRPSLNQNGGH